MLFVWARALVLSKQSEAPMIAPSWTKISRIGPWIRREKYKRYYFSEFTNESYIKGVRKAFITNFNPLIDELEFEQSELQANSVIRVHNSTDHMIYFPPLLGHEKLIRRELFRITSEPIKNRLSQTSERFPNFIGVHIRRGDFKLLDQTIPIDWYMDSISNLREKIDSRLPVLIFSDAPHSELNELRKADNLHLMPKAPAIHDLLMLSKSEAIIGTSLSTFSLWASFLERRPTYWPPVSPGVHGYGLDKTHHFSSNWKGQPLPFEST